MENPKGGARAPRTPTSLDTMNRHLVSAGKLGGDHVVIQRPPRRLTRSEALIFAAWVVVLAESMPGDVTFADCLRAVRK